MTRIRRRARRQAKTETDLGIIERWFTDKYNKPANDPLFLSRTFANLVEEFLEDLAERRVGLLEDLKTCQDPQTSDRMDESVQLIERILEIDASRNSWLEEVEAALEAGRMPEGI
jgi:hypothetical protein